MNLANVNEWENHFDRHFVTSSAQRKEIMVHYVHLLHFYTGKNIHDNSFLCSFWTGFSYIISTSFALLSSSMAVILPV